eukprot:8448128-Pyramimonas_sp.AAC.1
MPPARGDTLRLPLDHPRAALARRRLSSHVGGGEPRTTDSWRLGSRAKHLDDWAVLVLPIRASENRNCAITATLSYGWPGIYLCEKGSASDAIVYCFRRWRLERTVLTGSKTRTIYQPT